MSCSKKLVSCAIRTYRIKIEEMSVNNLQAIFIVAFEC
jgi:hypothetical protein